MIKMTNCIIKCSIAFIIMAMFPLSLSQVKAMEIKDEYRQTENLSPSYASSQAYVHAQYKTFVGPRAYVRQRINNYDYGGFVPYLYTDSFGMHHYGGLAPMIGANPYGLRLSPE